MRLPLQQVTLVAIDTRAPALAFESLRRSMEQVDFGRAVLFTSGWLPRRFVPGLEIVEIAPITSGADYSRFVLRQLPGCIRTSHVLITQWDGFVIDASAWLSEFLNYDYVGAVWPDRPTGLQVGNGGFSLRSRRMLAAGMDTRITELHPEDHMLCLRHRDHLQQHHGVTYAPLPVARRFAFENETPRGSTFGFHGPYHLPRFVPEDTLIAMFKALPDDFFRGRDARRLARALLARGMTDGARELLARRKAAGPTDTKTHVLDLLSTVMGTLKPRPR